MKSMVKSLFVICTLICALCSCEDNRLEGMVPDKLYIVQSGVNEVFVNRKDYADFTVSIYKSGIGDTSGEASVIIDQDLVDGYNAENGTSLELLPDVCYSITKEHFSFASKTVYKNTVITFDGAVLSKYQSTGFKKFVLPLRLISDSESLGINEQKQFVLIIPVLE